MAHTRRPAPSPRGDSRPTTFEVEGGLVAEQLLPQVDLSAMSIRYNVAAVAHRMRQDAETYVHQPAGMTWAAFRTLFALRVLGPSSPRDIAQVTYVSGPSISSVLNRLERERLIVRQKPIGGDGRTITVELTEQGLSVLTTLFVRNHARETEWAKVLNERERKTLIRLLRRLLEGEPHRP